MLLLLGLLHPGRPVPLSPTLSCWGEPVCGIAWGCCAGHLGKGSAHTRRTFSAFTPDVMLGPRNKTGALCASVPLLQPVPQRSASHRT
ncbi:hypothetical protein K469DRAFT_711195 [Zopfia rhizophila CBS 207.26]|uniref:Uncharacterized protein n=1 Tax=Zopfia rhizophila CBS 207.26 TaxID=1314779 RepID=A0A6A6DZ24_9PEZI|nr:hypothetical protein K469DRAFT_711195 [Zopfia rhizophila CBS 207.26]